MNEELNEYSQEEEEFLCIQKYHFQLIIEIQTLFRIYCGMCGEHAKETESAFARALFFTLFGSLEATCRLIAASALFADASKEEENETYEDIPLGSLSDADKLFLRQETGDISRNNWEAQKVQKLVSFQDALVGYPTIYARLFGIQLSIDKSCSEWQDLIKLKQLRDVGAHGNINILRASPETMQVSYKDIKRLLECRLWYCKQIEHLPWMIKVEMEGQIKFINQLLEGGFSEKCKQIRGQRYAQQRHTADRYRGR